MVGSVWMRKNVNPIIPSSRILLPIVPHRIARARWRWLRRFIRAARRSWRSCSSSVSISGIACLLLITIPYYVQLTRYANYSRVYHLRRPIIEKEVGKEASTMHPRFSQRSHVSSFRSGLACSLPVFNSFCW